MNYEIKTQRLLLRPLDIGDLDAVYKYSSDKENTKYMMFLSNVNINDTICFLRKVASEWQKDKPKFYEFAIILDNIQIGAISLYLVNNSKTSEIGWILNKKYWNNGYTTEAALAILDFAQNFLKLDKLVAHCDYRNVASYRVMEKIGMTLIDDTGTREYLNSTEIIKELMYTIVLKK